MSTSTQTSGNALKGGEFVVRSTDPQSVFIPEEFNEEHRMMADMAHEFLVQNVYPHLDKIDAMEPGLMASLLDKAGELGMLGVSIPEEFGGFGNRGHPFVQCVRKNFQAFFLHLHNLMCTCAGV